MTSTKRLLTAVVLSITLLTGCGFLPVAGTISETSSGSHDQRFPTNLSPAAVAELRNEGKVVVVDVRQDWEYEAVRVPDSVLIPLDELPARIGEVPSGQRVVLICRSGNRSSQALRLLTEEGFDNVHNLVGGITAWEQQGYPVE